MINPTYHGCPLLSEKQHCQILGQKRNEDNLYYTIIVGKQNIGKEGSLTKQIFLLLVTGKTYTFRGSRVTSKAIPSPFKS